MDAAPRCSSARAPLSDQILSPVVSGRFMTAATQSSVPAGSNDTEPSVWLRRATRVGGSSSSAAARVGVNKATARAMASRLASWSACFLITNFSPETSSAQNGMRRTSLGLNLFLIPECSYPRLSPHFGDASIRHSPYVESGNAGLIRRSFKPAREARVASRRVEEDPGSRTQHRPRNRAGNERARPKLRGGLAILKPSVSDGCRGKLRRHHEDSRRRREGCLLPQKSGSAQSRFDSAQSMTGKEVVSKTGAMKMGRTI